MNPAAPLNVPDFHAAGGIPAVMRELLTLLHGDAMTVSGKTVAENVAGAVASDRRIIRPLSDPWSSEGGLAVVRGNLAPRTGITKPAAIAPEMHVFRGVARCFDSEEAANRAILDGAIREGDVVVIRYEGPKGGPGMREMYTAMKLALRLRPGPQDGPGYRWPLLRHQQRMFRRTHLARGGRRRTVGDRRRRRHDYRRHSPAQPPFAPRRCGDSGSPVAVATAAVKIRNGYLALYARLAESADQGAIIRHRIE